MTHSEEWWELLASPTDVRCEGHYKTGEPCRRVSVFGSTVCRQHGGAAPRVQARAAARIGNAADDMVVRLHAMLDDPNVEARDKVKIAQDMLDRAGLGATGKLLIAVGEIDPVEALFKRILNDPSSLAPAQPVTYVPSPQALAYNRQALEDDYDADVVDAELVEQPEDPTRLPSQARTQRRGTRPPKHTREGLARAEELRRLL